MSGAQPCNSAIPDTLFITRERKKCASFPCPFQCLGYDPLSSGFCGINAASPHLFHSPLDNAHGSRLGSRTLATPFVYSTLKGRNDDLMALYKQLKVSADPDLVKSFKLACADEGVSMASELSAFMAARTGAMTGLHAKADNLAGYDTRAKRRHHVGRIVTQLESIMGHEDAYRARIPDNLQSGPAYENAELAVDYLEQAIDLLKDAY